jgi:hypothetical protein
MKKQMPVNPFEKNIVKEPRHVEKSVISLNDKPLKELIRQFERLENVQIPRMEHIEHAQFVVSPDAGYGKSHLIGRLFRELNQRATRVYLRPFEDPFTCWKSILLKTVQELDFPDSGNAEYSIEEPTQLEAFAHGILIYLITDAIEKDSVSVKNKEAVLDMLRKTGISKIRGNKRWINLILRNYDGLVKRFISQLRLRGIKLNASPMSWFGVLFTYAYLSSEIELRQICLDWLQGGSIDPKYADEIRISSKDILNPEMASGETNELCKHRISDLCQLAGFFRPFVFCFDQTERYGNDPILAKTFGSVIQALVDGNYNQMTLITANQYDWSESIEPCWEQALRSRLVVEPLELEGLNMEQAIELINQRLGDLNYEDQKARFLGSKNEWLNQQFQGKPTLSIRKFLNECSKRWQDKPDIDLPELYKGKIEEIKTQSKRLLFDPNILYWLVYEVAKGFSDTEVEKYKSEKGYFTLLWKLKDREILFGFEAGSNWSRWQAIEREAKRHYAAKNQKIKAVLFRTPELSKIPGSAWKISPVLEQAKREYLHIMCLEKIELEVLYAAYDLYMDAIEGNIRFKREEVIDFVRKELKDFWEQIQQPLPVNNGGDGNGKITKELIKEIRDIVQREKFLSVSEAIKKLSTPVSEELFHQARGYIPEIKIYFTSMNTVLQWQSK